MREPADLFERQRRVHGERGDLGVGSLLLAAGAGAAGFHRSAAAARLPRGSEGVHVRRASAAEHPAEERREVPGVTRGAGVRVGVVGIVHPALAAAPRSPIVIRGFAVVRAGRPPLAAAFGLLASPARGRGVGVPAAPVAAAREPALVGLGRVPLHGGALAFGVSRRDALDLFVGFLIFLGGFLILLFLDVLALRVGLLRLGLVVPVAGVLLPVWGEPGDGFGGAGGSTDEVLVLDVLLVVLLRIVVVGVGDLAVVGASRPAAAPGGRRVVVVGFVLLHVLQVLLVVPAIVAAARGPSPLASPRVALVVGGVPVGVGGEGRRRSLSRRASRPGAHRASMCIPDRTRTILRATMPPCAAVLCRRARLVRSGRTIFEVVKNLNPGASGSSNPHRQITLIIGNK